MASSAGVAELADALDSGSSAQKAWRFDSSRPHELKTPLNKRIRGVFLFLHSRPIGQFCLRLELHAWIERPICPTAGETPALRFASPFQV
jgi:hypothetical protein